MKDFVHSCLELYIRAGVVAAAAAVGLLEPTPFHLSGGGAVAVPATLVEAQPRLQHRGPLRGLVLMLLLQPEIFLHRFPDDEEGRIRNVDHAGTPPLQRDRGSCPASRHRPRFTADDTAAVEEPELIERGLGFR